MSCALYRLEFDTHSPNPSSLSLCQADTRQSFFSPSIPPSQAMIHRKVTLPKQVSNKPYLAASASAGGPMSFSGKIPVWTVCSGLRFNAL